LLLRALHVNFGQLGAQIRQADLLILDNHFGTALATFDSKGK
jgi:hypothetical protein